MKSNNNSNTNGNSNSNQLINMSHMRQSRSSTMVLDVDDDGANYPRSISLGSGANLANMSQLVTATNIQGNTIPNQVQQSTTTNVCHCKTDCLFLMSSCLFVGLLTI